MSASELLAVLADLKENRRLSFETDELIEPFAGKVYELSLSLVSSSNTIGNRYGHEYNDGVTLVCKLGDGELEASLQLAPGEKPFVESLADNSSFDIRATLLDFDTLHQRAIFGSLPEETTPEEEPPTEEAEEHPIVEEPSVVTPIEAIEPEVEVVEPEPVEPEIIEPQPVEPQPVEPEPFEPTVSEITQEDESGGEEKDIRKERQALLSQLKETVDVWRTSSPQAQAHEDERERSDYEGEEPEWTTASSPPKSATQRQTGLPPQQPEEPEQEGCLGCRGCLKVVVILSAIAFISIIMFSVKNETDRQKTHDSGTWHESDLKAFRALALEALHDPLNRTADGTLRLEKNNELFFLTKTAESTWEMLRSEFQGIEEPSQLSAVSRQSLVSGYAWVALRAEANQESLREKLHTPAGRRAPFHLMLDGDLIKAKVRVALRNPDMELDQSDLNRVKVLDLSNEQLRDISYLKKLTHLEHLNLSNNPINNLIALTHLKRLRELKLDNALVTNLVPIAEISALRHLSLANNPTLYLKPIERLKNLETLILTRGAASVQTPSLKKALPKLKILYRKP